ncbi:RHS repeat-associated core domain-containing protein [Actinoplanes sp. CA-142083]|uniref:RHS repeat-associated core domain-containing protein n=1 Tax=Actinoplanes sp. CA-142083 TaxID=3239903 RepID=UPI003D9409B4
MTGREIFMRSIRFALAVLLVVPLINGVVRPPMALAATGPSVPLPTVGSTPVEKQTMRAQPPDQASQDALHGNQAPSAQVKDGAGTNEATPLAPSASWQVSTQTGDFSWSYPLRVPPAPGGQEPELALSYASSAVDGRTSATNNQASWIGDGWSLSPGFVERSYRPCADDDAGDVTPPKAGDLCWGSWNATASYGGGAGMLIRDESTKVWHNRSEDGSRIELLTGAANGDDDGEYWKITTLDGTQYFFGSRPETKSAWTVPVFGDDTGEPCHSSAGFAASHCAQAWRWNLDKVVDRNGNMMVYTYDQETNAYGLNNADAAVPYVRGGTLRRVEYGLRADDAAIPATGRVEFTVADRCVPGSDCVPEKKDNWPDVSWDDNCATSSCADQHSPSFWSAKRLARITTQVRRGSTFTDVDQWTLDQQYPDPGDGGKAALWLRSITHTGLAGGSASLPAVTFEGTKMANRVYQADGYAPLIRYRVTGIVSESGGVITVTYAPPNCVPGASMPADAKTNTLRCFPQTWSTKFHTPRTDYFQKYVVAEVKQTDRMSSSTEQVTAYSYGAAAWHFNTAEFMKDDKRTWDEFRGFGDVTVRTGTPGDPGGQIGKTRHWYYRGMGGAVDPSEGDARADEDWLQGFELESATYLGDTDQVVEKTISDPYWKGPLATRGAYKAYLVRTGAVRRYTALASGGWRTTSTRTTYDGRGLAIQSDDQGDTSTAADDRCTTTTYGVFDRPARVVTVGVKCDATPVFPADAISDTKYTYDAAGNTVRTDEQSEHAAGADPQYVTTSRAGYDQHGRATSTTDARGKVTRTAYTPALGGPETQTVVTNPLGHTVTTTLEPAWGSATIVDDANNRRTETAYDPLGRVAAVWLPNRPRADNDASSTFAYRINRDSPSVVSTTTVGPNGNYTTVNTLFDGLLRPRQKQTPAVGGGRLLTDTRYDSQGRAFKTSAPYFNDAPVDDQLWLAADSAIHEQTVTRYDGAGREVAEIVYGRGAELRRTTTAYGGDQVSVTPPAGGTATTTISDARGRTTELRQYRSGAPAGAYDATTYTYTKRGDLASATDAGGSIWRNTYDLRGRLVKVDDPDKGASAMTYDNGGLLSTSTDDRGVTLSFGYDDLGRRTAVTSGTATLAAWTYDTATKGKGRPASSTRYVGGAAYTRTIGAYSALYLALDTTVTIPDAEGGLGGAYTTYAKANPDGSVYARTLPKIGNLPAETVGLGYDDLANPTTLTGSATYVGKTEYTRYGELERVHLGVTGKRVWQSYYYDTDTRRLDRTVVDAEVPRPVQADTHYTYDPAGNVTSVADTDDVQCLGYDYLRRLTEAWTPAADCAADPGTSLLAGAAPYWQSFTYDAVGNRLTETQHAAAGNTVRTYSYPADDSRELRSVTTVKPGGATKDEFAYDAIGNVVTRAGQTLDWDPEGKLTKVTEAGKSTEYVYDADGNRLIRRDPTGRTLYLDGQELRLDNASGTLTGTRFYQHAGATVAVRTGAGVTWLAADHQGTALVAVDSVSQQVTKRRQTPFGTARGDAVPAAFPGEKGFVGGTADSSTGLVHLGAREYDPAVGRFLSVDPVAALDDPQQMNAYAYAANNPVTMSDPSGQYAPSCNKFGDCMVGKKGPDTWAPPPPGVPTASTRKTPATQPSCNKYGDCRVGARGKAPAPVPNCDKFGDCRVGYKGPSIEELARRADRVSWEDNRKVGPPLPPPEEKCTSFICGVWDNLKAVTNSSAYKWIGVGLGVMAMFGCAVCGLVSMGMNIAATATNCSNYFFGDGTSGGDCATGAASVGLGTVAAGLGKAANVMFSGGAKLYASGHPIAGAVVQAVSSGPRTYAAVNSAASLGIDTIDASGLPKLVSGGPPSCEINLQC